MRRMHAAAIVLLFAASAAVCPASRADSVAYPAPENYRFPAGYFGYATAAQHFLVNNPRSPYAPRVALDYLVVADGLGDGETANRIGELILLNFTDSPQAKFLLAEMGTPFPFQNLMTAAADHDFSDPQPDFASKYVRAIQAGAKRFGGAAMGGGYGLVRTAVLAHDAGDRDVFNDAYAGLQKARNEDPDVWKVAQILLAGEQISPLDRLNSLHAQDDRGNVIPFENYVISRMSAADRDSSGVLADRVDDLLESNQLADARPLLATLAPKLDQPRMLFWQAWTSAATGDTATAETLFASLRSRHPGDPWSQLSSRLEPTLRDQEANLRVQIDSILAASAKLKNSMDEVQCDVVVHRRGARDTSIHLAWSAGNVFDVQTRDGDRVTFSYETTTTDATIYSAADNAIYHYLQAGPVPVPALTLTRPGGRFYFEFKLFVAQSLASFAGATDALTTSKYLNTADGLRELLSAQLRSGYVPSAPVKGKGEVTWTWVLPNVRAPSTSQFSYSITDDDRLTGIHTTGFDAELRYGRKGEFHPAPLQWPHSRTVELSRLDPADFLKAFSGVVAAVFPGKR